MILLLQHQRPDGEVDTYHLKPGRRYTLGRGSACEVRILDLKLSRQHCAFEYTDGEWRVFDLGSTNGCRVDGDQMVGSRVLVQGTTVEAGATAMRVTGLLGPDEDPGAEPAAPAGEEPAAAQPEPFDSPDLARRTRSGEFAADEALGHRKDWDPQPAAATASDDQDGLATLVPDSPRTPPPATPAKPTAVIPAAAPAPAPTTSAGEERPFFMTILGRKIGPLTRAQARDLKSRELKGTLTAADLAQYPQA